MGENFTPALIPKLKNAGCSLVRHGKGDHDIWESPINGRPRHADIALSLNSLGAVLATLGLHAESRTAWDQSFAIQTANGADPTSLIGRCRTYAQHAGANQDPDSARHWLAKAVSLLPADPAADEPEQAELRADIERRLADLAKPTDPGDAALATYHLTFNTRL